MLRKTKRAIVSVALSAFVLGGLTQSVHAAMIGTEQVAMANASQQNREKVAAALARPEVIAQLEQLGVDRLEAQARVAALTDVQAATLAHEIDKMPAGGDWTWAAWLAGIFLILVITDLIGWTHIFPWTKSKAKR